MRTAQFSEVEVGSGRLVDLLNPDIDDVSLWDIVNGLAGTCRFNGHVRPFYSTAQHSCIVASYLDRDEDRVHALLHDAPEFLLGDLSSPVKATLKFISPDFERAWKYLTRQVERAIYEAAGVALPDDATRQRVKQADLIALATEKRDVMRSPNNWSLPLAPAPRRIVPVDAIEARGMLIDALSECGVKVFRDVIEPADPKELQNDGDPIRAAALAPQYGVAA